MDLTTLPKVDLHRHLEGSLRLQTLLQLAHKSSITLPSPGNAASLSRLVQIQPDETLTFENFLAKFSTLRMFYRSPEVIERVTREAIQDAASDNIRYLELRFTPVALSRAEGFPMGDVMDWVCEAARDSAHEFGINVRLIASVNRHEPIELAEQVVALSLERKHQGIVGLDLAGNEVHFPALSFADLFKDARQAGLLITIHAGEWGGPENIRAAIEKFHADRIGHGVRILEDPAVLAIARERQIPFEVCLTSNYHTGFVSDLAQHPALAMLAAGLNVTFNTDDPSISQITLTDDYHVALDILHLPPAVLKDRILAAARAAFLPPPEKDILIDSLASALANA